MENWNTLLTLRQRILSRCPADNRSTLGYTHPNKPTPLTGHFSTRWRFHLPAKIYQLWLAPALFFLLWKKLSEDRLQGRMMRFSGLTLFFDNIYSFSSKIDAIFSGGLQMTKEQLAFFVSPSIFLRGPDFFLKAKIMCQVTTFNETNGSIARMTDFTWKSRKVSNILFCR